MQDDVDKLLRARAAGMAIARKRGRGNESEDVGSFFVEQRLAGRTATNDQLFVDYLRATYGDSRHPSGRARQAATLRAASIGEGFELADPRVTDPGARIDLEYVIQFLGPYSRAMFFLRVIHGFDEVAIGNIFGVSPSRISQKYKAMASCLSKAFKGVKARDAEARKRKMEEMGRFEREKISFRPFVLVAEEELREMASFDEPRFEEWLT